MTTLGKVVFYVLFATFFFAAGFGAGDFYVSKTEPIVESFIPCPTMDDYTYPISGYKEDFDVCMSGEYAMRLVEHLADVCLTDGP